jgi:hypothetical protein
VGFRLLLANDKKYDSVKKELAAFLPKVNKPEGLWKGQGGVD